MSEREKHRKATRLKYEAKELTAKERVELELDQLVERHNGLEKFLEVDEFNGLARQSYKNPKVTNLSRKQQNLLHEQREFMEKYRDILVLRLHYWGDE